ncbi:MAG: adenylosuccinate lyase [Phycisphaerae bacterium]|nr:adenylosuccinate lyase [Phycisphaerae bacterium]
MAGSDFSRYVSPLTTRSASEAMVRLFSDQRKFSTWRRLWLALAEAEKQLGLDIPQTALDQMAKHLDDIDFDAVREYEKKTRHDVMANIHAFGDRAPAAKGIIHLGATSCFVGDNAELIIMREAGRMICRYLANIVDRLGKFAAAHRNLPTLGFTHYQPAQVTTVGKRASLWCYDFLLDLENLERALDDLPFRSVKGTTGTQASFLALFDGDKQKVRRLEKLVAKTMGFDRVVPVCGQTYTRKFDAFLVSALANVAASAHKFANDVRLLCNLKEIEEPFEKTQVGSSAMAYKRNPMRSERITGLARFVISLTTSAFQTHAEQWFERTLDDSSNRRLVLAESFLAVDGILNIVLNVADGLVVNRKVIEADLRRELPFMATEEIMMAAVKAGGDRQDIHERIRQHSHEAARQVKEFGCENDLIERLKADPAFAGIDFKQLMDPKRYVGMAPDQVTDFIKTHVAPIRRRYRKSLGAEGVVNV